MNVVLYSTGCPKCKVLKDKLDEKCIEYIENNDKELMIDLGFSQVPILEVDGNTLNFKDANNWINEHGG